jgi:hypothetical protein
MRRGKETLTMTKEEYDMFPDHKKGHIGGEWPDELFSTSLMWNRTVVYEGRLYIEGFSLAII